MHLTKPAGCAFQIFGFFIALFGLSSLSLGGGYTFLGIILTPLGIWMFWRGRRSPERQRDGGQKTMQPTKTIYNEAKAIADKVTTQDNFRALVRKLDTAEKRMDEANSERAYDNASHKYNLYQSAIDIVNEKYPHFSAEPQRDEKGRFVRKNPTPQRTPEEKKKEIKLPPRDESGRFIIEE
jgi:hypothetical protein